MSRFTAHRSRPFRLFQRFELAPDLGLVVLDDPVALVLEADDDRAVCARGVGRAALHNSERGFLGAAELAKKAIDKGKTVEEIVEGEEGSDGV